MAYVGIDVKDTEKLATKREYANCNKLHHHDCAILKSHLFLFFITANVLGIFAKFEKNARFIP